MVDCVGLIEPALEEAVGDFEIQPSEEGCLVKTPFQHPDGDLLTVWIEHQRGEYYTMRDYGETFAYLKLRGADPGSESRQNRIANIHKQFNLDSTAGEIRIRAHQDELGSRLLDMIQSLLAVSHLVYTHRKQTPSRFNQTVSEYFESAGYDFESRVLVEGYSKPVEFDFGINHRSPETLLDTIHTNDKWDLERKADGVLLHWHEINDLEFKHGVIIDNVDGISNREILRPLEENLDYFFEWEYKEGITQEIPIRA